MSAVLVSLLTNYEFKTTAITTTDPFQFLLTHATFPGFLQIGQLTRGVVLAVCWSLDKKKVKYRYLCFRALGQNIVYFQSVWCGQYGSPRELRRRGTIDVTPQSLGSE